MGLKTFQGILGSSRAAHLLRRATFGPTIPQIDQFSSLTAQEAISLLFDDTPPDPDLPINPETGQDWLLSGIFGSELSDNQLKENFILWLIGLAIDNSQSINFSVREKIVFFFHTHLTTEAGKVASSRSLYFQNELFRQFAFDGNQSLEINFKNLLKKISTDNAMLIYLDGSQNVKGSPNENYARELMELYAMGRGLEGTFPSDLGQGDYMNYTEEDVQAAARVLSGFKVDTTFTNIDPDTNLPRGTSSPNAHDNEDKQFSNRFNNAIISPDPALLQAGEPTEESMLDELNQLIEMISSQQESALYICRKLYRFYVYHEISQELQNTVIAEMANTFIANNYKIQPVIEELLLSEHFYEAGIATNSDDKFGSVIKSPLDLVANTFRFFNISLANFKTDYDLFYSQAVHLKDLMKRMGLDYYRPFEVAGYMAFHQYPVFNRSWISSNYLANRYDFIREVFKIADNQTSDMPGPDLIQFTKSYIGNAAASNPRDLIVALIQYLFPVHMGLTFDAETDDGAGISAERLNYFLRAFLYEPQLDPEPETEWTNRWNANFEMGVVDGQLVQLINALLQSPEFQLM